MSPQIPTTTYDSTISSADCREQLASALLLDCRARLDEPGWGAAAFRQGHLPGAQHADLNRDLALPADHRGRHPLPERHNWLATIQQWGLGNNQQVIVYDDAGGAFAARAWWMFRWAGHAQVAVLDGGLPAWQAAFPGRLESGAAVSPEPSNFSLLPSLTRTVEAEDILQNMESAQATTLVDARTHKRWAGEEEPIDPVAGHIPGAVCMPFQDNLDANGFFKPADQLAKQYAHLLATENCVCYCGSGVTAAHNLLALYIAGHTNAALYPGSWSGWITDPNRPLATAATASNTTA